MLFACNTKRIPVTSTKTNTYKQAPGIVIYKTTSDYYNNVPVTLSKDKTKLVSYPAPSDLKFSETSLRTPTKLINNYLLDNKGIWLNSVFISTTYNEYSKLSTSPAPDKLVKLIIDKKPFSEFYFDADNSLDSLKGDRLVDYLNKLIEGDKLTSDFEKLK